MRNSLTRIFAAAMAAASLTVVAAPTYAASAEESPAQALQGWCDVVPPFCGGCQQPSARCRPGPCQVKATADRSNNDTNICVALKQD